MFPAQAAAGLVVPVLGLAQTELLAGKTRAPEMLVLVAAAGPTVVPQAETVPGPMAEMAEMALADLEAEPAQLQDHHQSQGPMVRAAAVASLAHLVPPLLAEMGQNMTGREVAAVEAVEAQAQATRGRPLGFTAVVAADLDIMPLARQGLEHRA